MELKVWLWERNMSVNAFAKLVSVDRCYLSAILHRKRRPSERLAYQIQKHTQGDVSMQSLRDMILVKTTDTSAVG